MLLSNVPMLPVVMLDEHLLYPAPCPRTVDGVSISCVSGCMCVCVPVMFATHLALASLRAVFRWSVPVSIFGDKKSLDVFLLRNGGRSKMT